jgi:hypothetical protein
MIDRLGGRLDEAARLVQRVGLSGAARIARRALGEPDAPYGAMMPWQHEVLWTVLARLCRYEHVEGEPMLPEPVEVGALEAALGFIAQMPPETRQQLGDLLCVFEAGAAVIGPERARRRFSRMSPEARDVYLARWEQSEIAPMRAAFQGLKSACMMGYWSRPATWPAISYALKPHPMGRP